ncbi:MAG: hypothetical protein Q8K32_17675 [Archangium sp.]|nr:hypothetical protein [Archangium sp.]MDP3570293.1 hypothetical protein [Archangium sp.]
MALAIGAAEVSVEVLPGTPCVSEAALVRKLRASGLSVVEKPEALAVTLAGEGRMLVVRARRFERRVPAGVNDCAAVERVTVALITAWAATEKAAIAPRAVEGSPPVTPSEVAGSPPVTPSEVAGSPPIIPSEVAGSPPITPSEVEGSPPIIQDLPDAGPSSTPLGQNGAGDGGVIAEVADAGVFTPTSPSLRFEAAALGGISAGATDPITAAGSVLAGFSIGRWGVLLEAGLESERAARMPPVRVSATMQWLSISFRVAFELLDSLTLDLALGARGWRVPATAAGVDVATDRVAINGGPALSAGLSWRLIGPLFLHLRPSVAVRLSPIGLNVEPLGRILVLHPWTYSATLGALFRFE